MMFFDFHHHQYGKNGIYNLSFLEEGKETLFSVGFHPKDIMNINEKTWMWFFSTSEQPSCFAIGECGLDGLIPIPENDQEKVFSRQIEWANQIKKPLIIHCVRRFSQLMHFKKLAQVPMIVHGFNKKRTIAEEVLKSGFYLSFGSALLYNVSLQEVIKKIPLDKLFIETDDSDVDIALLYQKTAELKEITVEELHNSIEKKLKNVKAL